MNVRMISRVLFAVAGVALLGVYGHPAQAVPLGTAFTYQGQLQQSGIPAAGTCDFQFDVFAAASGGSTLGTQTKSAATVTNGLFTIPDLDFGSGPFGGEDRYLEIQVRCPSGGGGYTLLSPRQKLTATPYALYAPTASSVPWTGLTGVPAGFSDNIDNDTLGGLSCVEGQIARRSAATWICGSDNNTTYSAGSGLTLTSTEFSVNTTVIQARVTGTCASGSSIRVIEASGAVTCEPDDNSGGTVTAITAGTGLTGGTFSDVGTIGVNFGSTAGTVAAGNHDHFGQSWSGGASNGLSVQNTSLNGNGLVGIANNGGVAYGVLGSSTNGRGVEGSSDTGIGVSGVSISGTGVYGLANGNEGKLGTSATGVLGTTTTSGGNGVLGIANNGASAYGVWGQSTSGYAGYFTGKVNVTGVLTAGTKPFKIDHPLDPANKYLYHVAIESPDMKNLYDGTAVLNDSGEAVVTLPNWFEALNQDFRYQLTCIGEFAPVYIADEVRDNRFRIAGGLPGLKVSWQVTGIRHDAFANAHRVEVEEDKAANERGTYLYPVELGMPPALSVETTKPLDAPPAGAAIDGAVRSGPTSR